MLRNNWQFWRNWSHTGEHPELFRPGRDWRVMLVLAGIAIVALIGAYFWIDQQIKDLSQSQASDNASSTTPRFTQADLIKYAGELESRQKNLQSLQQNPPSFADPSL